MYNLLWNIIGYNGSGSGYMSSAETAAVYGAICIVIILFVVLLDYWRLLFRALINRLK